MRKELKVVFNGKEETIIMKRLTWGDVLESLRNGKDDNLLRDEYQLLYSIKESSFPKTLEKFFLNASTKSVFSPSK